MLHQNGNWRFGVWQRAGAAHARGLALLCVVSVLIAAPTWAQSRGPVLTKTYDNGGVYTGTFSMGRPDGQGSYRLPNGY